MRSGPGCAGTMKWNGWLYLGYCKCWGTAIRQVPARSGQRYSQGGDLEANNGTLGYPLLRSTQVEMIAVGAIPATLVDALAWGLKPPSR